METIRPILEKRQRYALIALFLTALLGILSAYFYPLSPPSYIPATYRMPIVYFLIAYKLIELSVFYYLLLHRPCKEKNRFERARCEKKAKIFYYLVPQGSIVFGILSYKLSGQVGYLMLFLLIALMTLLVHRPEKLEIRS